MSAATVHGRNPAPPMKPWLKPERLLAFPGLLHQTPGFLKGAKWISAIHGRACNSARPRNRIGRLRRHRREKSSWRSSTARAPKIRKRRPGSGLVCVVFFFGGVKGTLKGNHGEKGGHMGEVEFWSWYSGWFFGRRTGKRSHVGVKIHDLPRFCLLGGLKGGLRAGPNFVDCKGGS